jgi:low temperature requirement protein LtrA
MVGRDRQNTADIRVPQTRFAYRGSVSSARSSLVRTPDAPERATLLELFFDLVFVAALALTSASLSREPSWTGLGKAVVPLMAIWWIWSITALFTDFYDPAQPVIQLVLAGVMLGTVLMTISVPDAFGRHGLVFAAPYVAIHLGRGLLLLATLRDRPTRQRAGRFLFWFTVSAVPWLLGGFTTGAARGALWAIALLVDFAAGGFRYPTPWLGRVPVEQYDKAARHLGERYQQFMILALGDIILVATLGYAHIDYSVGRTTATLVAFATAVLLWQIYTRHAGAILQTVVVRNPGRSARWAPYTHLIMVTGIVVTAAGFDLVIRRPYGATPLSWVMAMAGGPALFLAGRITFEYEVFGRLSRSRIGWLIVLLVVAPLLLVHLPPLGAAALIATMLLAIAVTDTMRRGMTAGNIEQAVLDPQPPRGSSAA